MNLKLEMRKYYHSIYDEAEEHGNLWHVWAQVYMQTAILSRKFLQVSWFLLVPILLTSNLFLYTALSYWCKITTEVQERSHYICVHKTQPNAREKCIQLRTICWNNRRQCSVSSLFLLRKVSDLQYWQPFSLLPKARSIKLFEFQDDIRQIHTVLCLNLWPVNLHLLHQCHLIIPVSHSKNVQ